MKKKALQHAVLLYFSSNLDAIEDRREDKIMICDFSFVMMMMMDGFCIFFKSSILKYPEAIDKTC